MSEQLYDAIIVGAGFSGIAMAIALQRKGIQNYLILEEANEVGGTWRENTYPGAECDVASALYSFSFEQNANWNFKWSGQEQIHAYQRGVAEKHGLYDKIVFGASVCSASYNQAAANWAIATQQGASYRARHFISAVGQLHKPATPKIPGQQDFSGIQFHSAKWRHDVDLLGKRVAVIGNAASALQFIPEIAPKVARLTVYQRSANWVMPKRDRPYSEFEQKLSARFPWITKIYRLRLWLRNEMLLLPALHNNRLVSWMLKRDSQRSLHEAIQDESLRATLTPDYPIGAKRILLSDDYYPAIARDNVHLQTAAVQSIDATGIVCEDGSRESVDVLIYGTGFQTNPFLADIQVSGIGGKLLSEHWRDGAQAYLGVTTHQFPNLYMLYGPNTNLGHNSIIIMIEAQSRFIASCIEKVRSSGARELQVKKDVEDRFNKKLQQALGDSAFSKVASSWYKDGDRVTNNWPHSTLTYIRRLAKVNWHDFELQ
ncbi:MAG: NAD(P)/FAD-dependent oxidoreductase [Gammaproteobacteria bacterium]|nr:NAD(P)/FAD-dependent oxidoreductase [Gammaproteobacteria bacterium]MBT8150774.1 NAD(P)/FAD-dependent oxidoreductase [Gammaproteobacteria bacterium]NND38113.1 NAD(P)/FAD-dependent oxidoreductase [Pseudomonadales bacterium]NNL10334.1 NAD(P)/FAD-dependent oxidoreductase [Pseudomonadales bacterium]RZV59191.1 MAG: NAD(P)/FAD-dependent oxidoreductase [Pseudomonadales bacterium]